MNPRSAALPIRSLRTLLLRTLLLCAPPALGLALGGCGSSAFKAETTQSSSVADGKSLFVSTDNGRVELIRDATAAEVRIEAKVRCTGATQAEADERLAKSKLVAVRDDAGCVRVSVEFPERAGSSWGWQSDSASITVRAADLSGIEVVTSNGSIVSGGFSGTATLVTSNGRISVDGHDGPVVARSSNGAITVSGVRSLTARTSNGRIDATLADGSAGDVDLDSSNGSVLRVVEGRGDRRDQQRLRRSEGRGRPLACRQRKHDGRRRRGRVGQGHDRHQQRPRAGARGRRDRHQELSEPDAASASLEPVPFNQGPCQDSPRSRLRAARCRP